MSLLFYKSLHLLAVVYLFAAVGAACFHAAGGAAARSKLLSALHGAALLVILVTGFGMVARLQQGFPGWVWAKVVIWLLIGAGMAFPYRSPKTARALLWLLPLLGGAAAWLALYKPF